MPVVSGQYAPRFTLFSSDKKEVSLADYKGKNVLLLFFPFAFSSVCTAELCAVRDNIGIYSNVNAEVLAISVDSLFTLAKFREVQGFTFPLLSDFNKEASAAYEVLYDVFPAFAMKGVSKRAAFIINKEGTVIHSEVCASPGDTPDFDAIRQVLGSAA